MKAGNIIHVAQVQLFYMIRAGIGLVSALGESLFVVAVGKRFGKNIAATTLLFFIVNCGKSLLHLNRLPTAAFAHS
jgi:hypothetical protein